VSTAPSPKSSVNKPGLPGALFRVEITFSMAARSAASSAAQALDAIRIDKQSTSLMP
jgi:hypothetical protein